MCGVLLVYPWFLWGTCLIVFARSIYFDKLTKAYISSKWVIYSVFPSFFELWFSLYSVGLFSLYKILKISQMRLPCTSSHPLRVPWQVSVSCKYWLYLTNLWLSQGWLNRRKRLCITRIIVMDFLGYLSVYILCTH